ncbi:hypothetical protein ACMDCR_24575 [Labrys okinawensis]|uniref:hypothetical protein n=1 Tax=Labrys okinawensis TaxID=346911 RepID=UPI0039BD81EE
MSVIVMEPMELNLLLSAATDAGIIAQCDGEDGTPIRVTIETAERFGRMILAENIRSHTVVYRSSVFRNEAGIRQRLDDYRFSYVGGVKPEGFARLADFADYQCSDSNAYELSLTYEFFLAAFTWLAGLGICTKTRSVQVLPRGIAHPENVTAFLDPARIGANPQPQAE